MTVSTFVLDLNTGTFTKVAPLPTPLQVLFRQLLGGPKKSGQRKICGGYEIVLFLHFIEKLYLRF